MSHHFTMKKIPKVGRQKNLQSHPSEVDIIDSYPNWKYTINMKIHNKLINNTFFFMCGSICLLMFVAYISHGPWSLRPLVIPPRSLGSLGVLVRTATVSMCPNLPKTKPAWRPQANAPGWTCCGDFVQLWCGLWSCMIYIYMRLYELVWYIYIHIQCVYVYIYIIYYYEIIYELFFVIWEYLNYDGDWGYEETQHLLANWPGRHQWAVVKKNHPSGLGRPLFAHSFTGGLLWG